MVEIEELCSKSYLGQTCWDLALALEQIREDNIDVLVLFNTQFDIVAKPSG